MENTNLLNPDSNSTPKLIIDIQPAKNYRFKYEVEECLAEPIRGANWTPKNPTFPKIHIEGYNKPVTIFVTCITKDSPRLQHPYKLVGRNNDEEYLENGICILKIDRSPFEAILSNLHIQRTKKRDMEIVLWERWENDCIPFNNPPRLDQIRHYHTQEVRLCFQAYLNETWTALEPVISEPIVNDRKQNITYQMVIGSKRHKKIIFN